MAANRGEEGHAETPWVPPRIGAAGAVMRVLRACLYIVPAVLFVGLAAAGVVFVALAVTKPPPVHVWIVEGPSGWIALAAVVGGAALWGVLAIAALVWVWRCIVETGIRGWRD